MTPRLLAALSVSALALMDTSARADYTLNILHFNDWHSRIESNNKSESTCSAEEEGKNECTGGAARLVTAVNAERERLKGQNVLLLDAGDNFQGSLFYSTFKGKAESEFLNKMNVDAMTVGNHEFDDGEDALAPFLDVTKYPVLGANVKAAPGAKVGDRIKPSVVLDVGGQRIGIIGVVTTDTTEIASPGPDISIGSDAEAVTAEVAKLEAQGVNKIIALTHVGYVRDRDVIAKIPGVDAVVGGHSHTLLSNTDPKAEGPYPTLVDNGSGAKVPVVQAASYSKFLGEVRLVFDDSGVLKEASGDPIPLDSTIKPDEAVLARIKELGAPIEELKAKVVAESAAPIDGSRETCRAKECAMGNLIADAMLERTKDQGVTIAIQNGGGIRASIDAGPVTMGEVLTVLPFQNTVATFQLSGADLVSSLEGGVSEIAEGKGKFPQVAGLRYTLDASKAPNGGRVSNVEVMENGAFAPIDPARTYTVVTNNYVRGGGDGYHLFAEKARNAYDYGPGLEQVMADYLAKNRPYQPKLEGRITEVAQAAAAEPANTPVSPAPAEPAPAAAPETSSPEPELPQLPAGSNEIANSAPPVTDVPSSAQGSPEAAKPAAEDSLPSEPAEPEVTEQPASPPEPVAAEPATPAAPATPDVAPAPAEEAPVQAGQGSPEAAKPSAEDSLPSGPAPAPADATPSAPAPGATAASPEPATTAEQPPAPASASTGSTHVIVQGDSYWKLAETFYRDGAKWRSIAKANPGFRPRALPIGATIQIPPAG